MFSSLLVVILAAPPAYRVQDGAVQIVQDEAVTPLVTPCAARAVAVEGAHLYVACGAEGLLDYDLTDPAAPVLRGQRAMGGFVAGLHAVDGRVWVEVARTEAVPAAATAFEVPAAPLSPRRMSGTPWKG